MHASLHRRFFAIITAVLMVCTGLSLSQAQPAMAAGCYASGCYNKNPATEGCDASAITVASFKDGYTYVELRYSKTCNSVWTRGTREAGREVADCNTIFLQIRSYDVNDNRTDVFGTQANCVGSRVAYTNMMGPGASKRYWRACKSPYGYTTDPTACTSKFTV